MLDEQTQANKLFLNEYYYYYFAGAGTVNSVDQLAAFCSK